MAEAPDYISHSALSQYLRCSWQYKLERIDKIPTPPAWYFLGGKAVHACTQAMDELGQYPYSDDRLQAMWSGCFSEEINQAFQEWPQEDEWVHAGRRGVEQGYAYWNDRGLAAVKAWQDWVVEKNPSFVGIEREAVVELPSGITLKGYIDRIVYIGIDNAVAPLDIKTSTKRPSSPLQLGFYKVALEGMNDLAPAGGKGYWWMAKDGKEFEVDISHITVETLDEYAKTYYRGVENEVFIPNVGDACFFCHVKSSCFAYPKVVS